MERPAKGWQRDQTGTRASKGTERKTSCKDTMGNCFSSEFKRSKLLGKRFFKGKLHTNKVKREGLIIKKNWGGSGLDLSVFSHHTQNEEKTEGSGTYKGQKRR